MGAKDKGARRPDHRPRLQAITILVTAVTVAIATHAVAAIGAIPSDGRFTACYQTSDNVLNRILVLAEPGEQCPTSYARVSWPAQASGGATGPPGPPGARGPQGPPGLSRLGGVRVVSRAFELRAERRPAIVFCNRRETAIGGGFDVFHLSKANDLPIASYPWIRNGRPVGWAFYPRRLLLVESFTTLSSVNAYITRVDRHNHALHLPKLRVAVPGDRQPFNDYPISVDVYAICALR